MAPPGSPLNKRRWPAVPTPPTAQRSRNMAAVRRSNTQPELALRHLLHKQGLRYRVDYRLDLPGGRVRPDIVFTRRKVAIFVDGCFWHGCPEHATYPATNVSFWHTKLTRNTERDRADDALLAAAGWTTIRVWEHESPDEAVNEIVAVIQEKSRATEGGVTRTSYQANPG